MKPGLYFLFISILSWTNTQVVFAQQTGSTIPQIPFSKGSWQLGLKDGYGGSPLIGNRNTVHLQAGYYVVNRLLVGFGGSYGSEFSDQVKAIVAVGPLIRYQFIARRLSPYTELSYQYGRQSTRVEKTLSFTPGLSVGLFSGLRVDLSYSFQYINMGRGFPFGPDGQPQVGINYLFKLR